MSEIKRLAVFCGSSPGARPEYVEAARAFPRLLSERGIGVVYGGSNVGVMAALANEVLDSHGDFIGVMPRMLVDRFASYEPPRVRKWITAEAI